MSHSTNNNDNLMPIGRFANTVRLSVKALRHYDERGVLKPAFVDPDTGYRYYRHEQARDAVMIAMLRSLEVPLDKVKILLSADEAQVALCLDAERARVERELEHKRQTLSSLERLARSGALIPYDIAIRTEPDYRLASMRTSTYADTLLTDSEALIVKLLQTLSAWNLSPCDPFMCVNETPDSDGGIIVHACVGVDTTVEHFADESVQWLFVEGGPTAWLTHTGAYEELGVAYHAVAAWAQQHGHVQRGPLRELYRNDPADTPVDELVTEVLLPIQR